MAVRVFNKDVTAATKESKENDLLLGMVPAASMFSLTEFSSFLDFPHTDIATDLMIGHMTDRQFKTALECIGSRRGILIRCSSAPEGRREHRHDILDGVVVLELRPSFVGLGEQDWEMITAELGNSDTVASRIIYGEISSSLRDFFGDSISLYFLPTLSILCQGFLAAHSNHIGEPEAVPEKDIEDVRHALDIMKWPNFCQSEDGKKLLVGELLNDSEEGFKERENLRKKVTTSEYWEPFLKITNKPDEKNNEVIDSIYTEEWDGLPGNADWEQVTPLLRIFLPSEEKQLSDRFDLSSKIVARAFIHLANRLGVV